MPENDYMHSFQTKALCQGISLGDRQDGHQHNQKPIGMRPRNVRIQDVAKAAGVSTATVSRALSNPDLLTESTRSAVFDAIRNTGYRVNRTARNLRRQTAGAVLVLVPNLGNPFFSSILQGISETFAGSDYSVLIADTRNLPNRLGNVVDGFMDGRIGGMISLDGGFSINELSVLTQARLDDRVVFACEWVGGAQYPSVRSDNAKGAQLAMQHLFSLGHRDIAHITGPETNVLTHVRRDGTLAERARLGLPVRPEWIIRGDFSLESGRQAAQKLAAMEDRPTAVFCASDEVAFGLISGLTAHGIRVPEDISVVGFDDIGLAEYYIPALTTIRQNRLQLGQNAARMLLAQLEAPGTIPNDEVQLVDVELVVRDSCTRLSS